MSRALVISKVVASLTLLALSVFFGFGAWQWVKTNAVVERFARNAGLLIEDIQIAGTKHTSRDAIMAIAGCGIQKPILSTNVWQIKKDLELKSKWIHKATVARRLPNKLEITIEERQPIAIWRDKTSFIIDKTGFPITKYVGGDKFKDLPIIEGANANLSIGDISQIIDVNQPFAKNISVIVRISSRRWNIITRSGTEIMLPEEGYINAWRQAINIMESGGLSGVKRIDMRIAGKVFFTKK